MSMSKESRVSSVNSRFNKIQSQWWRVKWEEVNTHVRTMSMSKESRVSSVNSRFNTKSVVASKMGGSKHTC